MGVWIYWWGKEKEAVVLEGSDEGLHDALEGEDLGLGAIV